jgi:ribose transport system ATP-binding protein
MLRQMQVDAPVMATQPILEMRAITKHFPGLVALDSVDFSVQRGEIHALIGQNGAGKSTLMKILAGVYPIEGGELYIAGQQVHFGHPRDALRLGIGTVYQDLSLVPHLSVADNIFLGREAGDGFVIDEKANVKRAAEILAQVGIQHIDVRARTMDLPLAQQQLVEIAKVLSHEPRILILDEPTAALAEEETTLLFGILKTLRAKGIAIVFISHRFKEIIGHCDRATVLRNGKLVKTIDLDGVTEDALIELTIGEQIESFFHQQQDKSSGESGAIALDVENLSVGRAVRNVSFQLRRGEIVGITGLLGAGQNELARALFGIQQGVSGVVRRDGNPLLITSPKVAVRHGIGLLTEHRKREGLILEMNVRENITLPSLRAFRRALLFLRNVVENRDAQRYIERLDIKTTSPRVKVGTLSGGNQQKVILAKWLLRDLDILLFIAPTQGIDVGAKAEIYAQLGQLAAEGKSIIVVSEDLIEILGISDRILIMYHGRLTQQFDLTGDRTGVTEEVLLSAIQGNQGDGRIPSGNSL